MRNRADTQARDGSGRFKHEGKPALSIVTNPEPDEQPVVLQPRLPDGDAARAIQRFADLSLTGEHPSVHVFDSDHDRAHLYPPIRGFYMTDTAFESDEGHHNEMVSEFPERLRDAVNGELSWRDYSSPLCWNEENTEHLVEEAILQGGDESWDIERVTELVFDTDNPVEITVEADLEVRGAPEDQRYQTVRFKEPLLATRRPVEVRDGQSPREALLAHIKTEAWNASNTDTYDLTQQRRGFGWLGTRHSAEQPALIQYDLIYLDGGRVS